MLLQGIALPQPAMGSSEPLERANDLLAEPIDVFNAVVITEPADATGQANVRKQALPVVQVLLLDSANPSPKRIIGIEMVSLVDELLFFV